MKKSLRITALVLGGLAGATGLSACAEQMPASEVEARAEDQLGDSLGEAVDVDCPGDLSLVEDSEEMECRVQRTNGESTEVDVEVDSVNGDDAYLEFDMEMN
ncbi:DUF4333 domain-containing protein [Kytococcus sp. Marseille-QA3725]